MHYNHYTHRIWDHLGILFESPVLVEGLSIYVVDEAIKELSPNFCDGRDQPAV
jgi:hypothetical protein